MRVARRRRILRFGLIPAVVCAGLALYRPAWLTRLDLGAFDTLVRATGSEPPLGRIVIVDIDDRSLAAVGRWPWRRDVIARLITRLRDMGAQTIALDIIFAEPDREQPAAGPSGAETPSLQNSAAAPTAPDALLAETLRDAPVVVGHAFTFEPSTAGSRRCVLHPLRITLVQPAGEAGDVPVFQATDALCSLPIFAEAAGASGFLNAAPDLDGILRRVPMVLAFDSRTYPALGLAAVTADQPNTGELRVVNANALSLAIGDRLVPLDGRGNLLLRYRGPKRAFPYVAAADVLDGQLPADTFRDKIVFVGATALGLQELVSTPYDSQFPGVEVQATVADNLLRGDFIRRPAVLLQLVVILVLSLGITLVIARAGVRWGVFAGALCLVALWGTIGWLLAARGVYLSPLLPSAGLLVSVVALSCLTLVDDVRAALTGLQRARHETESAARAKNEFLMAVSHELRTPLSIVYGYAQMLAKGALRDEQKKSALAVVERNARAQTQLIDDLLVASQSAAGKLRLEVKGLNLAEVVRSVVENARSAINAKRIELRTAIDDDAGLILGDRDRLQQVVWNLVSNAIKFAPERGTVDIRLERVKSSALITVSDSGAGIAPEFLPRVFEQFQQHDSGATRQHGGLGLSLALARHVVELHGGSIEVESGGNGHGATFRVRLPLNRASAVAARADDDPAGAERLDRLRVLVVDDHTETRALIAAALLEAGAHVVTAASLRDGLSVLKEDALDILAVSLDMANDDGYRLAHEARDVRASHGGRPRIVALGGDPSTETLTQLRQAGVEQHVPKPLQPEHVVLVIDALAHAPISIDKSS